MLNSKIYIYIYIYFFDTFSKSSEEQISLKNLIKDVRVDRRRRS